jgi:hypothetical protein
VSLQKWIKAYIREPDTSYHGRSPHPFDTMAKVADADILRLIGLSPRERKRFKLRLSFTPIGNLEITDAADSSPQRLLLNPVNHICRLFEATRARYKLKTSCCGLCPVGVTRGIGCTDWQDHASPLAALTHGDPLPMLGWLRQTRALFERKNRRKLQYLRQRWMVRNLGFVEVVDSRPLLQRGGHPITETRAEIRLNEGRPQLPVPKAAAKIAKVKTRPPKAKVNRRRQKAHANFITKLRANQLSTQPTRRPRTLDLSRPDPATSDPG